MFKDLLLVLITIRKKSPSENTDITAEILATNLKCVFIKEFL